VNGDALSTEIKLPELGENVISGDLIKVLVSVGDTIAKDQALLELETEKANIEVPSPASGTVKQIHVKAGDKVTVGQLLFTIEESDQSTQEASPTQPGAKPAQQEAAERPQAVGGKAEPQRERPREKRQEGAQGPRAVSAASEKTRQPGAESVTTMEQVDQPIPESDVRREPPGRDASDRPAHAAPSIRRLARELGVDVHQVPGTGLGGRISEEDVKQHARRIISSAPNGAGARAATDEPPLPDFSKWGEIERQPMSSVRRTTARHLAQAWRAVPHVCQFDRADITDLENLRKQAAEKTDGAHPKITITAIAVRVAAFALQKFPHFKASLDAAKEEIIYKKYCHIGVAVDTDRGLFVPVVRDADRKALPQIASEIADLSEKARSRKLTLEDMAGGVFSITNLGGIGGTGFSPIVNFPEVAILGISRAAWEPKAIGESFHPHLFLPLSLSYDHRLIDGADAARFLRWIAQTLEQPALLLFEA
jgi:pyruvate dehydrogenase E2 component (dihydrolipoamide acetyltransferase)